MLAELVESVTAWAEQSVEVLGLPGIVLLALFENLFPPTPSEFLYPLAGKLAYDGKLTVIGVILAGILGSLTGSLLYYSLGARLGETRVRQLIARYGHPRLFGLTIPILSVDEFDTAVRLFQRRGGIVVVVARLMPLVHSVISIPAGVTGMPLSAFITYTVIGSALWIAPLTIFGWWLGSNWERILYWLDIYQTAWYAVMALALAVWLGRRLRAGWRRRQVRLAGLPPDQSHRSQ